MQISVNRSDLRYEMPLEACGWLLRRLMKNDETVKWVMVVSPDLQCQLAANLLVRWPTVINVFMGLSILTSNVVCFPVCDI